MNAVLKYSLLPLFVMGAFTALGQAKLVLNGAKLVIANNATLVIDNDAPDAIIRTDGSIISEGEGNKVQWMIGQTTGTYTIPWSDGTTYMPLTFTKSAGVGDGSFIFSTYPTPPQNSLALPSGVTNLNRGGEDRSLYFIDRFWQLNAQNYVTKPSLTNVQFGYIDAEYAEPNTIWEMALGAVRWNDDTQTWDGYGPVGNADLPNDQVVVPSIAGTDLYSWWSLTSELNVLPLRFLSFSATRQGNIAKLVWKTAYEVDVLDFEVQRSVNGSDFLAIGRTPAYNASGPNTYLHADASPARGINAYRIKETSRNGTFHYSETRTINMDSKPGSVVVYPNPVTGHAFTINATGIPAGTYNIQLYGLDGKLAASFVKVLNGNHVTMRLDKSIAKGMYLLKLTSGENAFSTLLMVDGN